MLSTLLILAVYRTRVVYELRELPIVESLWLSGRASEHGIRRSEVRFLMELRIFSLYHACDKMRNIFLKPLEYLPCFRLRAFFNISCI